MNINDSFAGNFIKAGDIGKAKPVVIISHVQEEEVGEETKPVVYFVGKDKGLVLNKTNANTIIDLLGSAETEDWSGKRIRLFVTKVEYQGKRVDGIRVEAAPRGPATAVARQAPRRPAPEPEPDTIDIQGDELTDEEIPF